MLSFNYSLQSSSWAPSEIKKHHAGDGWSWTIGPETQTPISYLTLKERHGHSLVGQWLCLWSLHLLASSMSSVILASWLTNLATKSPTPVRGIPVPVCFWYSWELECIESQKTNIHHYAINAEWSTQWSVVWVKDNKTWSEQASRHSIFFWANRGSGFGLALSFRLYIV